MTYPNSDVAADLAERFLCSKPRIDQETELATKHNVHWTPGLLCLTGDGKVHYRTSGYLPPEEFRPLLRVMEGTALFHCGEFQKAAGRFEEAVSGWPRSHAAPEALYWLGVSQYRLGDKNQLVSCWTRIKDEHPESLWHLKSSFIF